MTLETNMVEKDFDSEDFARILPSPHSVKRSMDRADSKASQSSHAINTVINSRSFVMMYGLPEVGAEEAAEFERE